MKLKIVTYTHTHTHTQVFLNNTANVFFRMKLKIVTYTHTHTHTHTCIHTHTGSLDSYYCLTACTKFATNVLLIQ